jgi:hypothetical protein
MLPAAACLFQPPPLPPLLLPSCCHAPPRFFLPCREAKARTTNAQVGDAEFLQAACRFLPACSAEQVRLAPPKCERM